MKNFQDAVARLNSRNLESLLLLSSYLSCLDFFSGLDSPIFPLWNYEKQRLLGDAILASRAASYKSSKFTRGDLRYVINAVNEALDDPRLGEEVQSGRPRTEMIYKLDRFFARMANVQLRHQEHRPFMSFGRLIAIFKVLPTESLDEFPSEYRALAEAMPAEIEEALGGSILQLALVHQVVVSQYSPLYQRALKLVGNVQLSQSRHFESAAKRRVRFFNRFLDLFPGFAKDLELDPNAIKEAVSGVVPSSVVDSFLRIFGRRIGELRSRARESAYHYGPTGWQLSPLERFPVVALGESNTHYGIPNVRSFVHSFPDVVHFTLQDVLGSRYNVFRGVSQEVFLGKLVEDRLNCRCVIRERPYRKSLGEVRGPDLTIVENPSPRLILIESKGKRLLAETRFTMTEDSFDTNYDVAYEALRKIKSKIEDLYAGLGVYSDVQRALDATRSGSPIVVVVVGESSYMMTELIRYRAEHEPGHPLEGFTIPFCVMSLQTFEIAIQHSVTESRPLYEILEEFWKDSRKDDLSDPMAEGFRGREVDEDSTYSSKLFVQQLGELKTKDAQ